jgi:flavorubredoxin
MSKVKDIPDYMAGVEKYYQDIMSPFSRPFVVNGIKAVRDIGPDLVLPGHGAVLDSHLEQMLEMYERLSAAPEKSGKSVAMIYVSAYGYTRALARAIGQELEENGIAVRQIELDEHNKTQALEAVALADGVLFGSPTFLGDALQPIGELLAALHPYNVKGKLCAAFGSYGWSGEAVANITGRLEQLRARTMPGVRARLRPGAEELAEARAFAERFAKELS